MYGVSGQTISKEKIGEQLGVITSINLPMPIKSGESNSLIIQEKRYSLLIYFRDCTFFYSKGTFSVASPNRGVFFYRQYDEVLGPIYNESMTD